MHLSHITEDLANWYLNFDFAERVGTVFRPGKQVPEGTQTVAQPAAEVALRRGTCTGPSAGSGTIGHSRLDPDDLAARPRLRRARRHRLPRRAPRCRTGPTSTRSTTRSSGAPSPLRDKQLAQPAAGVHFVVFNPTSDDFHRNRLAMDGVLPDGTRLPFARGDRGQGFNAVLQTTHRQNFLVPPRRHRSFPLVELLT